MVNTFKINGDTYTAKEFDLNMVCDMEDLGVSMDQIGNKQFKSARSYFVLCSNKGEKEAGVELQQHIINGGNLEDIYAAMEKEMKKSDFFQALVEGAKKNRQGETGEEKEASEEKKAPVKKAPKKE